jgi:hypothetical protein
VFFGNNFGSGNAYTLYGLNETDSWNWSYSSVNNWNWRGSPAVAELPGYGLMVFAGQSSGSNNRFYGFDADPDDNNDGVIDGLDSDEGQNDILGAQYDIIWEATLNGGYYRHSPLIADISALGGNVIYMGTTNGIVYCLNATNGAEIWNWTDPTGDGFQYGHPTLGYDVNGNPQLFIINDGAATSTFYALDAVGFGGTTTVRWTTDLHGNDVRGGSAVAVGGVGADDDRVFFATWDNPSTLYCFDASPDDDGNGIPGNQFGSGDWDEGLPDPAGMPWDLLWSYVLGGSSMYIASTPALHNGRVYIGIGHIGSINNALFALEQNGTMNQTHIVWTYDAPGDIYWNSPAVADGKVIVTTRGYWGSAGLAVVNENTGAEIWFNTTAFSDNVETSCSVAKGNIYVGGDDNFLHVFGGVGSPTVDYIMINDTAAQGGNWVGDKDYNASETDTFYAHGFNTTMGYIGNVEVVWNSNDTGVGSVNIGPSSSTTFTANAPGYCQVTATYVLNPSITNDTGSLHVLDWTVDYILIVDSEATGSVEILNQTVILGFTIQGWAASFNDTQGYLGDISVTWTVDNFGGASASTFPVSGTNSTFDADFNPGTAIWTADDGLGHNNTVAFTITDYTVDYIIIVDSPGSGITEIPDQIVDVGFTIGGWASAFNNSANYIGDISVTWSVTNISSSATTNPTLGINSTFHAGADGGQAQWIADDGLGHLDYVNFTITPPNVDSILIVDSAGTGITEIPDQPVPVGFQITGYAAAFNDTLGYIYDVSVFWDVFNSGTSATTTPLVGTTSDFYSGTTPGTATWIADYGGITDYVNFTVDVSPDYILIVDTPNIGISEIPNQTVSVGFTINGWAAAYNNTAGYIGDVPVTWSVINSGSNAFTNPSSGVNSTFNANSNPGTATWKADDGLGNQDTVIFTIIADTVDYIVIVDSPNSGTTEILSQPIDVGVNVYGWAAAFNSSGVYLGDVSVTWNTGSTASTNPLTGVNSTFYSGTTAGQANWTADDGSGHTDSVIFTVNPPIQDYILIVNSGGTGSSEIPDQSVSVNFTIQGWAAGFNNTIGYMGDVTVTWFVLNDGSTNATTNPILPSTTSTFDSGWNMGNATWIADDGSNVDTVVFTIIPPTVDYIIIVDTDQTGSAEIPNMNVDVGFVLTGWAAGFNNSIGYIGDIIVDWTVGNSGTNASTNPLSNSSSDFYSGWFGGSAIWTADDGQLHSDTVTITVSSPNVDYIEIVDFVGTEISNQTIDIGFSIQGFAASYNLTTGFLGDVPVSWSVDNINTNSTTTVSMGTSSTYNSGWKEGTATWIADDGSGHNDTVIFSVNPPSLDYILIVDSPNSGIVEIPDHTINVGQSISGWAAGFNNIAGYIGDVSVTWTITNFGTNAQTDPPSGSGSNFSAGNSGGSTIWRADHTGGNSDTVSFTINPPFVDYIQIRDAPDGGGNVIDNPTYPVGHTTRFYGALINRSAGFIDNAPSGTQWTSDGTNIVMVSSPGEYTDIVCSIQNYGTIILSVDDGDGHLNSTQVTVLVPTTDELKIMDTPGGAGSEISNPDYPVGATDTYYGAMFNDTAGYIGDVLESATWSSSHPRVDVNSPGSSTAISCSNTDYGTATITLDDNDGHTEDVVCEILIPTVDSVEIKDAVGPGGTTPLDHSINIGESETYYAIGFNETSGNIGSVDVDWDLSNFDVGVLSTAFGTQTIFTAFLDKTGVTIISARYNSQNVGSFTLTILDNIPPEAHAGSDQTAKEGESVLFDGADSSDNVEIATYTWTFTHKKTPTTLEGETVLFEFEEPGTYVITLEVMDFSGNTDIDTFTVIVEGKEVEPEDNLMLWLLLLIIITVVVLILAMILLGKKKKKQRCRICGKEFYPQTEAEAKQGMCPNCAEQGVFGQSMGSAAGGQPTQSIPLAASSKMTIKCPSCQMDFEQEVKGSGQILVTCPYCNTQGQMEI